LLGRKWDEDLQRTFSAVNSPELSIMKNPISSALLVLLSSVLPLIHSFCAEPAIVTNAAAQDMIRSFLRQEALRLDAQFLEGITNRHLWEARRPELRQQYFEMLGLWPLPERTPLNALTTGVIEREEGFRVEKLHFQSRPHLYVTGNLYLPKDAKPGAKLPAVLYVCGHSGRDRDGNKTAFQHHGMWFATHGYVCLIIDSLQLGEIAAIHHGTYRYDRWWWQARGYAPSAVECWNGVRALDYLQSRPEVDPDRLAVTGISGGGAASFWIAAADERVKVAVPVSGMDDLEDYVGETIVNGHCDCMFLINTFQWPWTYIAALIAPRPLLFENSGHDPIFPMNGNDRIRARLERLYGFYTNRSEQLFDIGITPVATTIIRSYGSWRIAGSTGISRAPTRRSLSRSCRPSRGSNCARFPMNCLRTNSTRKSMSYLCQWLRMRCQGRLKNLTDGATTVSLSCGASYFVTCRKSSRRKTR
jgi:dienelactone hydrolase